MKKPFWRGAAPSASSTIGNTDAIRDSIKKLQGVGFDTRQLVAALEMVLAFEEERAAAVMDGLLDVLRDLEALDVGE